MKVSRYFAGLVGAAFLVIVAILCVNVFTPMEKARAQFSGGSTWLGTAGGSANAITLNLHNVGVIADVLGTPLRFIPSAANTNTVTITFNLDGGGTIGPLTLQRPTSNIGMQTLAGGELQTNVVTEITYSGTLLGITSAVSLTPVGAPVEFRGGAAPAGTLIEDGSCVSQTQYAALFSVIGTTYNAGAPVACTGATFAVPYSSGTIFAAADAQGGVHTANRITNGGSGCVGTTIGALCGGQSQTLTQAQLPAVGLSVSTSDSVTVGGSITGITSALNEVAVNAGSSVTVASQNAGTSFAGLSVSGTFSGSGTGSGSGSTSAMGSGSAHPILNPVLIGLRAIKY